MKNISKLLAAGSAGAVLALLLTPKGVETRKKIFKQMKKMSQPELSQCGREKLAMAKVKLEKHKARVERHLEKINAVLEKHPETPAPPPPQSRTNSYAAIQ